MNQKLRSKVRIRSGGRCEAVDHIPIGVTDRIVKRRCFGPASEIHHALTKGRGGAALDKVDEDYHLIHLCRTHHRLSDGAIAYTGGLLIEGSVIWDKLKNFPVYTGPDKYLKHMYGPSA